MARRNVDDELKHDVLVEIAAGQERRFGTGGKMLKPSRATVAAAVRRIPKGSVATISALRATIAAEHGAATACPFMTKRALMAIAEDPKATAPYWRVVRPDGKPLAYFPGGPAAQARRLKAEGAKPPTR